MLYCILFLFYVYFQASRLEGQPLLQVQRLPQQELQQQASRTTAPPGLSTTDTRLLTTDREGRRLDRQLPHSRDRYSIHLSRVCLVLNRFVLNLPQV